MSRVATVDQGLSDYLGSWSGDPARSGERDKSINLARRNAELGRSVPSNQ